MVAVVVVLVVPTCADAIGLDLAVVGAMAMFADDAGWDWVLDGMVEELPTRPSLNEFLFSCVLDSLGRDQGLYPEPLLFYDISI